MMSTSKDPTTQQNDQDAVDTKKQRNPRRKFTYTEYEAKIDDILEKLTLEIEKHQKVQNKQTGAKALRTIRKDVKELKSQLKSVSSGPKRSHQQGSKPKSSGFVGRCNISDELRLFLELQPDQEVSRSEIINALNVYVNIKDDETREQMLKWKHLNPDGKRNLQDPNNGMKIIPDDKLSKMLRYEQYKQDVSDGKIKRNQTDKETKKKSVIVETDTSLKYYTLPKLINFHITK